MSTRRQAARNASASVAVLALQSATGLLLTPFLVRTLGVAAYGLVPLAISIGSYVSVATIGIQTAVGRYLTIAVARHDRDEASAALATSLWSTIILGGLIAVPLGVLSFVASSIFSIPDEVRGAAGWFFFSVMISYLVVALREVIGSVAFSYNRLDQQSLGRAIDAGLRLSVPIVMISLVSRSLSWVGVGMAAGAIVSLAMIVGVWRTLDPTISGLPRFFDRSMFSQILRTGGWISLNQVGSLLHLSIDVTVVNLMLGAVVAGEYGTVAQWPVFLRAVAGALIGVLTPVMFGHFATERMDQLVGLSVRSVRLVAVASGLGVALIGGLGEPLLRLWLGSEFAHLWPLLLVSVIHMTINLAMVPLFAVHTALNRVRGPAIVTLVTGLLNVALSVWWSGWGTYGIGVAVATLVALTAKNALYTPLYTARILNVPAATFVKPAIPGVVVSGLATALCFGIARAAHITTWVGLALAAVGVALVYVLIAWRTLVPEEDRATIRAMLRLGAA